MKRARTDDEPIEGDDGGKILLIKYRNNGGAQLYSLDSVTPLVYSYLQTANDKHAEHICDVDEDYDNNVSPLNKALSYIWRAIGYGMRDEELSRLCPELRESTEKVDFDAWNEYKTTFEDVNVDRKWPISNVFTLNCCEI